MEPWPSLVNFARKQRLPESQIELHLFAAGEPNPTAMVLLHGLGDEADTWRSLFPTLARSAYTVAPDLPGFGRSDKPQRAYTIPFYEQVISELSQVLQVRQMTLVGHSMGAVIAQSYALSHPEQVRRLVLISGGLVARVNRLELGTLLFLVPGVGEWLYNRLRRDPQAAYQSLQPYYHDLESLPQAERDFLFQRVNQRVWSDGQRDAFLSSLRSLARWLPAQQKRVVSQLASFNVPTTVIWGENDQVNDIANGTALVEAQPSARLVRVPDAGHNLHQEKPEAVLDAIMT